MKACCDLINNQWVNRVPFKHSRTCNLNDTSTPLWRNADWNTRFSRILSSRIHLNPRPDFEARSSHSLSRIRSAVNKRFPTRSWTVTPSPLFYPSQSLTIKRRPPSWRWGSPKRIRLLNPLPPLASHLLNSTQDPRAYHWPSAGFIRITLCCRLINTRDLDKEKRLGTSTAPNSWLTRDAPWRPTAETWAMQAQPHYNDNRPGTCYRLPATSKAADRQAWLSKKSPRLTRLIFWQRLTEDAYFKDAWR